MQTAALEASRPTATIDIAKELAIMLFEEKTRQKENLASSAEVAALV
jgi:hypothetical protein